MALTANQVKSLARLLGVLNSFANSFQTVSNLWAKVDHASKRANIVC